MYNQGMAQATAVKGLAIALILLGAHLEATEQIRLEFLTVLIKCFDIDFKGRSTVHKTRANHSKCLAKIDIRNLLNGNRAAGAPHVVQQSAQDCFI
jgi:hypothetical protein